MTRARPGRNPFYVLLVIAGAAFGVTALAYGVMTAVAQRSPARAHQLMQSGQGLMALLDRYGAGLMVGQLVVLAIVTVLAIATDSYWQRRDQAATAAGQPAGADETGANKEITSDEDLPS